MGYLKTLNHRDMPIALVLFSDKHNPQEFFYIHDKTHFPVGVNEDIESLKKWLELRNIPMTRENIDLVKEQYNIKSSEQFAGMSRNVSLTDCYWFATQEDVSNHVGWKDVNFHENHSSSNLSEILFYGNKVEINNLETPDISTNGTLRKLWKETDHGWYLIKAQYEIKQQVFGEIASYKLAQMAGINTVPYYHTKINGELCSVCPCLINSPDKDLVAFWQLKNSGLPRRNIVAFAEKINAKDSMENLFALDFLINNTDRNDGNVSFIRNAETLEYEGIAPLFDHGESFGYDPLDHVAFDTQKSFLTGNNLQNDFENSNKKKMKKIDINEAKEMLYALGDELGMSKQRINVVSDACINRINIYNREIEKAKENGVPEI